MRIASYCFLSSLLLAASPLFGADIIVRSGPERVHLLELYTSEGCSSCPPAERWFSALCTSPKLWKDVVPVAFHVDYWDNLGWKDALARPAFTARQRRYAASWGTDTVYTPGFVLDGREWQERDLGAINSAAGNAGLLSAVLSESGALQVTFQSAEKTKSEWQVHAALLGFGLSSNVKAGENSGRKLQHDFVALAIETAPLTQTNGSAQATLRLAADKMKLGNSALVVWITEVGKTEPLQAAGAPL